MLAIGSLAKVTRVGSRAGGAGTPDPHEAEDLPDRERHEPSIRIDDQHGIYETAAPRGPVASPAADGFTHCV